MDLSDVEFYPETHIIVKSLNELRDNVEVFSGFDERSVTGSVIQLEEDGQVTVDGETRRCTVSSMKNLCKTLRIPDPFANRIPIDLLRFTVNRLSKDVEEMKVFSSNTNGHWVNLTKEKNWGVETIPLLDHLEEEVNSFKLISGEISEAGVTLDYRSDLIDEVQDHLETGSITQFGRRFTSSESGFGYPQSTFMAWRLVCSNGVIAPKNYGVVKCRQRGNQEAQIASFIRRCQTSEEQIERFANTYATIAKDETSVPDNRQLFRIWGGTRKILGDAELADEVIGFDNSTRSKLRNAVKAERCLAFNLEDEDENEEEIKNIIDIPWFTLMNRVTSAANDVRGRPRTRLQELGGKILSAAAETIQ